jgi:hypothetical protein
MDSLACSQPVGYVTDSTDCNDTVAAINPAATEVCDGVDNNCDGSVDEGFATTVYYLDFDGDTYGDAAMDSTSCSQPSNYVTDNTDCDDTNPSINPAGTEIADNGIDEDCIGGDLVGINEVTYSVVSVYPNPGNDYTVLQLNSTWSSNVELSIYSVEGRLITKIQSSADSKSMIRINTKDLANGMYMIRISDNTHVSMVQWVKQN